MIVACGVHYEAEGGSGGQRWPERRCTPAPPLLLLRLQSLSGIGEFTTLITPVGEAHHSPLNHWDQGAYSPSPSHSPRSLATTL